MGALTKPQPRHTDQAPSAADTLSRAAGMLRQGEPAKSEALSRSVVDHEPDNAHAWYLRGLALRAMRNFDEARACLETATAKGFTDAVAYVEYARTLILLGERQGAETQYLKALEAQPDLTAATRELGSLCLEAERLDEAEQWFAATIRIDPSDSVGRRNLAHALFRLDRAAEAIATLDEAVALVPGQPDIHVMLATLHELENDLPAAQRHAEAARALDPGNPSAAVILAKLAHRRGADAEALDRLDGVDIARMSDAQHVTRQAERGRVLDRLGRYEEAFAAYRQSGEILSRLQKGMPAQDLAARAARMSAVEDGLSRERRERLALRDANRGDSPAPIFVLGFMRSGTTLIERILGAHPEIAPMGELPLIADSADKLNDDLDGGFPRGLFSLETGQAREVLEVHRRRYLSGVLDHLDDRDSARFIVDKAPFNAEHIGLIRLIFPEAPIIHAVRHPLDVVLSSFFVNFADPLPWSFSLDTAAALFVRMHDHLTAMTLESADGIRQVRYESLVEDPNAVVGAMLDHIGVGWDEACLNFNQNVGGVRTASYAQVARPLYDSSVFRYRNYLPFIDRAVLEMLQPTAIALGYDYSA